MSSVKTPMARDEGRESIGEKRDDVLRKKRSGSLGQKRENESGDELSAEDRTKYRAIAARANYLAIDRPDLMYLAKELCRRMASPTSADWGKLVRLGRYLKGRPVARMWYRFQDQPEAVETYSDTDWAGCRRTRRSTTGGYCAYGRHILKMWCKTQAVVALSSAEAELYGIVRASAETLGVMSLFADFGQSVRGCVLGDASAALAIVQRQGIGKLRHLDTNYLWIQEKASRNELRYEKVLGRDNAADLLTKALTWEEIQRHCEKMETAFDGEEVADMMRKEVNLLAEMIGEREKLRCWTRVDLQTKTAKTTLRGGPHWGSVVGRVAINAKSGEVLLRESAQMIGKPQEHREVVKKPVDMITGLLYRV